MWVFSFWRNKSGTTCFELTSTFYYIHAYNSIPNVDGLFFKICEFKSYEKDFIAKLMIKMIWGHYLTTSQSNTHKIIYWLWLVVFRILHLHTYQTINAYKWEICNKTTTHQVIIQTLGKNWKISKSSGYHFKHIPKWNKMTIVNKPSRFYKDELL